MKYFNNIDYFIVSEQLYQAAILKQFVPDLESRPKHARPRPRPRTWHSRSRAWFLRLMQSWTWVHFCWPNPIQSKN